MPLMRAEQSPVTEMNGDVYFAMVDERGQYVPCEVSRDYLIAVAENPWDKQPAVIFAEERARIEANASEDFDVSGPDEEGILRLEPWMV
jgi:hypothetical protein